MDLTGKATTELEGISRRLVVTIFGKLRRKIGRWSEQQVLIAGTIKVDESYFGPRRIPCKQGRGASGKTIVFGIFKHQGKVYTEIVPDVHPKDSLARFTGKNQHGMRNSFR